MSFKIENHQKSKRVRVIKFEESDLDRLIFPFKKHSILSLEYKPFSRFSLAKSLDEVFENKLSQTLIKILKDRETGTVKAGKVQIVGVAMGGTRKVRSVKVSVDGGKSWKRAKFVGPDLGKYAWRQFVLETTLASGSYNIASLASNGRDKQPELRMENRRGYAHNGWKDHSVNITVV